MINGVSEYPFTVTGEKYDIDEHYTCPKPNCVYAVYWENCSDNTKKT